MICDFLLLANFECPHPLNNFFLFEIFPRHNWYNLVDFVSGSESSESRGDDLMIWIHMNPWNPQVLWKNHGPILFEAHPKAAEDLDIRPVALVWALGHSKWIKGNFCMYDSVWYVYNIVFICIHVIGPITNIPIPTNPFFVYLGFFLPRLT